MSNEAKRKRRMQMGDADPNGAQTVSNDPTSGIPPQPMVGAPQGKGNMMNNPMVGQSMGNGNPIPGALDPNSPRSAYGDKVFTPEQLAQTGAVGFYGRSNQNENLVPGRLLNQQAYNTVDQPKEGMSQEMLLPQGMANEAVTRAQKLYAAGSGNSTPSYQVGPLGMMGTPVETSIQGNVNPGQFPLQMPSQSNMSMPLTGNTTAAIEQKGMSTGRGGGRNQKPNKA